MKNMFPNLHINVLFQAEGCTPIVAEIQIHHERVLAVTKQDHKLYEVTRAHSIAALVKNTVVNVTVVNDVAGEKGDAATANEPRALNEGEEVSKDAVLEEMAAEIVALREENFQVEQGVGTWMEEIRAKDAERAETLKAKDVELAALRLRLERLYEEKRAEVREEKRQHADRSIESKGEGGGGKAAGGSGINAARALRDN